MNQPPSSAQARRSAATKRLLEGPILPTLARLAAPNVLLVLVQTLVSIIETWLVSRLGTVSLAALALVFPFAILMQMMSAGAMGGGVSSAISRAGCRRCRACRGPHRPYGRGRAGDGGGVYGRLRTRRTLDLPGARRRRGRSA
jgi:hypothetical protein